MPLLPQQLLLELERLWTLQQQLLRLALELQMLRLLLFERKSQGLRQWQLQQLLQPDQDWLDSIQIQQQGEFECLHYFQRHLQALLLVQE